MKNIQKSSLILLALTLFLPVDAYLDNLDFIMMRMTNLVYAESMPEFVDLHIDPLNVQVGDAIRLNATIVNNTPNTITFPGLCDSPLSAEFDANVVIEQHPACLGFSIVELKSGEKTSVTGPASGIVYRASNAGLTNAKVTFTYSAGDEVRSISKSIAFTILETQNQIQAKLNMQFKLKIDQTAYIEAENIKVQFTDVREDSRCPSDVFCVWEGQATIALKITKDKKELREFTLTSRGGEPVTKTFDGYSIKLVSVEPYPTSTDKLEKDDYVVTLAISSVEQEQKVSVALKIKEKISLLAIKNTSNSDIHSVKIAVDDSDIKFVKTRGWSKEAVDSNTVVVKTTDRPITKGHIMVILLVLEDRYAEITWTVFDAKDAIIESGAMIPSQPEIKEKSFKVQVVEETFVIYATDPQTIQQLIDNYHNKNNFHVTGKLVVGDGGFNSPWSWHLDPDSVRMAEFSIELCDGLPSHVEADLDYWINTAGTYCPWSSKVVQINN